MLLIAKQAVDHVAHADHADQALVVDHGQVTRASIDHQTHAVLDAVLRAHRDEVGSHQVAHRRLGRAFLLPQYAAHTIAFGKYSDDALRLTDQHRADLLFAHQRDRVSDGRTRLHCMNMSAFVL